MTAHDPGSVPRARPRGPLWPIAGGTVLAVVVILVVLSGSIPPAAATAAAGPSQWSNGVVLCIFNPEVPGVAVSAVAINHSGLYAGVGEIEELTANGSPVATAWTSSANWTIWNASSDDDFDLAYAASVPISTESGRTVGTVDVRVDFILPAYAETASDNLSSVAFQLEISNWTWQAAGDSLALVLPLYPSLASSEHLVVPAGGPPRVLSVANATGTPREQFVVSPNATVNSTGAPPRSVAVTPLIHLVPGNASVTLRVPASAGRFQSMVYVAQVGVLAAPAVFGLPLYDYALVGGAAAAVTLAVAAGSRAARRRPSDLVYAEEERS